MNFPRTLVITAFCLIATLQISAQQNDIYFVKFEFNHSLRIDNYHVLVELQRRGNDITVHVVTEPMEGYDGTKRNYQFELSKAEFDEVCAGVKQIDCKDIVNDLGTLGLDGTICEIEYGSYATAISYKVWSPDLDTRKRNLTPFLNACKLILETGKLKPKEIL